MGSSERLEFIAVCQWRHSVDFVVHVGYATAVITKDRITRICKALLFEDGSERAQDKRHAKSKHKFTKNLHKAALQI